MNAVRRKKLMWVMFTLAGAAIAVVLVLYAIGQQTDYTLMLPRLHKVKHHKISVFEQAVWSLRVVSSAQKTIH